VVFLRHNLILVVFLLMDREYLFILIVVRGYSAIEILLNFNSIPMLPGYYRLDYLRFGYDIASSVTIFFTPSLLLAIEVDHPFNKVQYWLSKNIPIPLCAASLISAPVKRK
jgi:hypothetical protein